jgi:signal transduction histidine kinase
MKSNCLKKDAERLGRDYRRAMAVSAAAAGEVDREQVERERRARLLDIGIVVVITAMTVFATWHGEPIGDRIQGPVWLRAIYPVLLNLPLLWRRTYPLASWAAIMAAVTLQDVVSGHSPEGLEMIGAWVIGAYSVAAYSTRRGAFVGLAIGSVAYGIYAAEDANIRTGEAGELWAGAFFAATYLVSWLVGMFVRSRREESAVHARAAAIERDAQHAVAEERARMARELHDIVSHNLSVVVVQAAGARAQQNGDVTGTLEKIEQSGRDALVEMRRLLGVLRSEDDEPSLAPQPGLGDLTTLADTVRHAGLPVTIDVAPDCADVSTAGLSAYRIVQEALTNALKHAQATAAIVSVRRDGADLTIDVVDDGVGTAEETGTSGYGLRGMEERVKLLGGSLHAGPRAGGGFGVSVTLPVSGTP